MTAGNAWQLLFFALVFLGLGLSPAFAALAPEKRAEIVGKLCAGQAGPRLEAKEEMLKGSAASTDDARWGKAVLIAAGNKIGTLKQKLAILIVEQYLEFARSIADRSIVLLRGEIAVSGRDRRDGVAAIKKHLSV